MKKKIKKLARKIAAVAPKSGIIRTVLEGTYRAGAKVYRRFFGLKRFKAAANEAIDQHCPEEKKGFARFILMLKIYGSRVRYGIIPKEYFIYGFNMLSAEGRGSFVTRSNKYKYYKKFNSRNYVDFLNQKTETYRKFGEFYGRDVVSLYTDADFESFKSFVEKHPRFIYKPAQDYGGRGIKIYDLKNYDCPEDLFAIIIFNGACVLEELIVQGEEIARIHPDSVNTVRLVTYHSDSGDTYPQWCFLRMGSGGSHTDNMSGGGISALVDFETGVVCDCGRDYLGHRYIYHPDTNVQLVGLKLPHWDEVRGLACRLAAVLPEVRFVGWDLAYSDRGWVFVEGNAQPQCVAPQIMSYNGKLRNYKEMDKIYEADHKALAGGAAK